MHNGRETVIFIYLILYLRFNLILLGYKPGTNALKKKKENILYSSPSPLPTKQSNSPFNFFLKL